MKLTILTTIYPQKGLSIYSDHLLRNFNKKEIKIEVISFKNLYPNCLYPDGINDKKCKPVQYNNVVIKKIISWFNPFSWFKAALSTSGDIIHIQWWTYFLFPIYFICHYVHLNNNFNSASSWILFQQFFNGNACAS